MTDDAARPRLAASMAAVAEAKVKLLVQGPVAAEVLAYDRTDQTVTVQPLVRQWDLDEQGRPTWQDTPPVAKIPVAFLRCGSVTLTAGVAVGDVGLLVARDRSHAEVNTGQGETPQVSPASFRRWNLSDSVYLPASIVPSDPIGETRADGSPVLGLGAGQSLRVGVASASVATARADRTDSRLDALEQFAATHTHPGVFAGGASTAVAPGAPSGLSTASTRIFTDDA